MSELWPNRLLNLSEFQLNHMISYISELLLKFGRIQPIFRKIQICFSVTLVFTEIQTNSADIQKNSDLRFRKIQICISAVLNVG